MLSRDDESRRDVIRANMHGTRCYLLAQSEPCLQTASRQKEANRMRSTSKGPVGRDIVLLAPTELADLRPPTSWLLVVLLCDGDDVTPLSDWARKLARRDLDRLRFYNQERVQPGPLLQPWVRAGLPAPKIDSFSQPRSLSASLGRAINERIHTDHARDERRPPI